MKKKLVRALNVFLHHRKKDSGRLGLLPGWIFLRVSASILEDH